MPINTKTNYGDIKISDEAIASLAGSTVCECYGIVGVVSKSYVKDSYNALLKKESYWQKSWVRKQAQKCLFH